MARQQERARRTRAAIIGSAATEFGRSGYAAASLNRILEGSQATKGAMYFHFDSKEDLARAVMETALERFTESANRWTRRTDLDALEIMHGIVDELALRLQSDPVVQAEFRLIIEPDFYPDVQSEGCRVWRSVAYSLAERAKKEGILRSDVDIDRFIRTLAAVLGGQRYIADLFGEGAVMRRRFQEAYELVVEASATPEWLARWRVSGWRDEASAVELVSSV